ncbi:hypothetical protein CL654_01305 [bacterium]|nr:hypothetical protein [bacterium]|tara:strand:- start:7376 stop:7966 length:591 start_codon:yes stop_codon:yes gene_type:complete
MQGSGSFTWSITQEEFRNRRKKAIRNLFIPLLFIGVIAGTVGYPLLFLGDLFRDPKSVLATVLYILGGIVLASLVLYFGTGLIRRGTYSYSISEKGISISVGKKKKDYEWILFRGFYEYLTQNASSGKRHVLSDQESKITGGILYLIKKGGFIKIFVVVYTEPDNHEKVINILSNYLSKEESTLSKDLGLTRFEFK